MDPNSSQVRAWVYPPRARAHSPIERLFGRSIPRRTLRKTVRRAPNNPILCSKKRVPATGREKTRPTVDPKSGVYTPRSVEVRAVDLDQISRPTIFRLEHPAAGSFPSHI